MTEWTDFTGDLENGMLVTVEMLQQIINNTTNIYERIMVLQSLAGGITPVGSIMLWKGSAASIPQGFQLADGTNGTPDLRGLFVVGIAATEGDNDLLKTGGSTQHTNAVGTIQNTGSHGHAVYLNDSSHASSASQTAGTDVAYVYHNHSWSATTGSSGDHTHTGVYAEANHLPPYTKYYWIARIPA